MELSIANSLLRDLLLAMEGSRSQIFKRIEFMRCSLDRSRDSNLLKSIRIITSQKRYPLETKFLKEFLAIIAIRGSKMGKPSQVSKTQARQFQRQVLQSKFVSQIKGHIRGSKLVTTL